MRPHFPTFCVHNKKPHHLKYNSKRDAQLKRKKAWGNSEE